MYHSHDDPIIPLVNIGFEPSAFRLAARHLIHYTTLNLLPSVQISPATFRIPCSAPVLPHCFVLSLSLSLSHSARLGKRKCSGGLKPLRVPELVRFCAAGIVTSRVTRRVIVCRHTTASRNALVMIARRRHIGNTFHTTSANLLDFFIPQKWPVSVANSAATEPSKQDVVADDLQTPLLRGLFSAEENLATSRKKYSIDNHENINSDAIITIVERRRLIQKCDQWRLLTQTSQTVENTTQGLQKQDSAESHGIAGSGKHSGVGAGVAEWLACSPSPNAYRVHSPAGSPDFGKWKSCRTMPLVGGFSRGSPVSPSTSFRRRSIFTSITLIGSRDLAVKSRPNLFTVKVNISVGEIVFIFFFIHLAVRGHARWNSPAVVFADRLAGSKSAVAWWVEEGV
ncbi:hypothetical protein PR048_031291 [Dryococelus australis]|uniref:Uncharacterized protein n=1 Tax=Dryococelus australis TaxID=614101 RepID=A0ABQ9G4U2_9NEOP|nr:hypothetical protein PR048_031291 [Dryococelus australis]